MTRLVLRVYMYVVIGEGVGVLALSVLSLVLTPADQHEIRLDWRHDSSQLLITILKTPQQIYRHFGLTLPSTRMIPC